MLCGVISCCCSCVMSVLWKWTQNSQLTFYSLSVWFAVKDLSCFLNRRLYGGHCFSWLGLCHNWNWDVLGDLPNISTPWCISSDCAGDHIVYSFETINLQTYICFCLLWPCCSACCVPGDEWHYGTVFLFSLWPQMFSCCNETWRQDAFHLLFFPLL